MGLCASQPLACTTQEADAAVARLQREQLAPPARAILRDLQRHVRQLLRWRHYGVHPEAEASRALRVLWGGVVGSDQAMSIIVAYCAVGLVGWACAGGT